MPPERFCGGDCQCLPNGLKSVYVTANAFRTLGLGGRWPRESPSAASTLKYSLGPTACRSRPSGTASEIRSFKGRISIEVGGRSFGSQLGKVIGANIADSAKELILGGNLRRLLTPVPAGERVSSLIARVLTPPADTQDRTL